MSTPPISASFPAASAEPSRPACASPAENRPQRMRVTIDDALTKKCPRVALGCVFAEVAAPNSPAGLVAELNACEQAILGLPEPRSVLESAQILATRAAYKALGKDPSRYRGSAEPMVRR